MVNRFVLSFFWQHIKPYKWYYLIMLLVPIVTGFYPIAYNYAVKMFLDIMNSKGVSVSYMDLAIPIALFMGTQFILDFVWKISNIAEWRSEPYVRRSILLHSYKYVQNHSYNFFQDNFTGAISSKVKGILDGYDKFWEEIHHGFFNRVITAFLGLLALSVVNLNLCAFVMLWAAIYTPIMYQLSKKLNELAFSETESRHSLLGIVSDTVINMISMFAFAARKKEYRDLDKAISDDFIPKQIKVYKYDFIVSLVGGFLYLIMYGVVLFYMIHLKMEDKISIGDFAFVFGMTLVVTEDIWHATISLQDFARDMGDLGSSISILQVPQENLDKENAKDLVLVNPTIKFENVDFSYGGNNKVFENLNFEIKAGEKIGIVGGSGAGKSTLVNLLLKYFNYDSGRILIDNEELDLLTQDSVRNSIAIIPQDTMLFHRTLMENIRYGNFNATDEEVIEASKKAHIHEFIMTLPEKYDTHVGERGIKLSGGQRQRVAIARAILKNSPILILDEATSSLDSGTEKIIQESLDFLMKDKNKTLIAIAHRLSTLKYMDRIIVLEKGKIIEEGTHNKLIRNHNSLYAKLWKLQELG